METLIGLALKSLLIAGATLALLHLTRRRSASERSLIAHLGLMALVALPLASLALPALRIDLPELAAPAAEVAAPPAAFEPVAASTVEPAALAPLAAAEPEAPAIDWTPYAYALPAIALLLLTLVALFRLFALRGRAQVLVDPTWLTALAHAQRRMGFKNGTALLITSELGSPISWGLMRPVILLNDEALAAKGEAEAIIAHELAHVVRLDWAKLMLARVATAIFWFNPLAWLLAREAHQLREEAADDAVLAANIDGADYAQLLVGVARHECKGLLLGAHGVAPSKGSLRRRVGRVLDGTLARAPANRSWVAGFAAGMLVMAAPLAALTFAPEEKLPEDSLIGKTGTEGRGSAAAYDSADMPSPATGAIGAVVASAVNASVAAATGVAPSHPDFDEEMARDIAIEASKAREDARRDRDKARKVKDPIELAIEMKLHGVDPDYVRAIRAAGPQFRKLGSEEMVELKVKGVTPRFVQALSEAGYRGESVDAIGDAAIMGVTPEFIRSIRATARQRFTLEELTEMRTMGVSAQFIEEMRRLGYAKASPDQLIRLKIHGVRTPPPAPRAPAPPPEPDQP